MKTQEKNPFLMYVYLFVVFAAYTYMNCLETLDWKIENILVLIFIVLLSWQRLQGKFKFNNVSYLCIFLFLALHEWGAQYVYSHHPIGEWMRKALHLQRNGYDRLVHFSFGLLMYYPLRQWMINKYRIGKANINFRIFEIIICFATIFELIEFAVANYIFPDEAGNTYVGTQGDVWDAHKHIVMAMIGCGFAIVFYKASIKIYNYMFKQLVV